MRNRISQHWRLITPAALLAVSLVTLWASNWNSISPKIQAKGSKRVAQQCQLDIYPASTEVSAAPGEQAFGFGVAVEDGCSWQVQSAPSWVRIVGGTNIGTGSSGVIFLVDPNNTGVPRSGVIFLNDNQSHVVSQQ